MSEACCKFTRAMASGSEWPTLGPGARSVEHGFCVLQTLRACPLTERRDPSIHSRSVPHHTFTVGDFTLQNPYTLVPLSSMCCCFFFFFKFDGLNLEMRMLGKERHTDK